VRKDVVKFLPDASRNGLHYNWYILINELNNRIVAIQRCRQLDSLVAIVYPLRSLDPCGRAWALIRGCSWIYFPATAKTLPYFYNEQPSAVNQSNPLRSIRLPNYAKWYLVSYNIPYLLNWRKGVKLLNIKSKNKCTWTCFIRNPSSVLLQVMTSQVKCIWLAIWKFNLTKSCSFEWSHIKIYFDTLVDIVV